MGIGPGRALRVHLRVARVGVYSPRAVRAVASVDMRLPGARARLVRVPRRRYLHVFRVDRKLAFGAEVASLYLRRLPGLYRKIPARKEGRALPRRRFLFVLRYARVYVQLNVTAEAQCLPARSKARRRLYQVGRLRHHVLGKERYWCWISHINQNPFSISNFSHGGFYRTILQTISAKKSTHTALSPIS